jgi:hypothetical protein
MTRVGSDVDADGSENDTESGHAIRPRKTAKKTPSLSYYWAFHYDEIHKRTSDMCPLVPSLTSKP